jgi:hypothetical protein
MNRTLAQLSAAVAAVLVVSAALVAATLPGNRPLPTHPVGWSAADTPLAKITPVPFPAAGKVFLGLQTNPGAFDFGPVDAFVEATGIAPSVQQFSQGWAVDDFDASRFNAIAARGTLPILAWEPWDYRLADDHGNQPAYRLSAIADGEYDSYINSWATGIAALPYPVVIRFAHEMNGFWYPWCEQSNGNQPGDYVRAWRHVHDLFTAARAENVTWMWSPNVTYAGAAPLSRYYPGDSYVDWIGLSGYYGTGGQRAYLSFDEIFDRSLTELATFTAKPVVISETGATDVTGQRTRWIREMFARLPSYPEVIGVIWFEATKEIDWRIAGSPAAAAAFAEGAADPRYDTTWSPAGHPRTT